MLHLHNIQFSYDDKKAILKKISYDIKYGDFIALIGANGSGKTTLVKLINGTLSLKKGKVTLDGVRNIKEYFKINTLYLPSDDILPGFLSGREYLEFLHKFYKKRLDNEKLKMLARKLSFVNDLDNVIDDYSTGMKKKLQIILAVLIKPKLLISDETLNGMDIESVFITKEMLSNLSNENTIIIMCSHDLSLLEDICNKFIIIKDGVIAKSNYMQNIPISLTDTFKDVLSTNHKEKESRYG